MPLLYLINENILQLTDYESTPTDEILQGLEVIFNDPQFGSGKGIILDLTQHLGWKSIEELKRIAGFLAAHRDQIGPRNAIVAPDSLQNSLAQIFSLHTKKGGVPFDIFTDIDEARRCIQKPI
jgi:hypothetical protein